MTLTTHALVGAAAASLFPAHPYIAFAAGFASHFAIDSIPHWDYVDYLRSVFKDEHDPLNKNMGGEGLVHDLLIIGADALLGCLLAAVAAVLLRIPLPIALIGAGAGIYPDALQFVYYKVRTTRAEPALRYLQLFHQWIQEGKHRYYWSIYKGIGYQVALIAVSFFIGVVVRVWGV